MTDLRDIPTARLVGLTALAFSTLYLLSDVVEAIQGGFSDTRLWVTLVAEAAIPVFVIGLYAVQRPQIGRLGQISAVAYACSYVFFTVTVTVVYVVLVAHSQNLPEGVQLLAASIRDLGFAGMGASLLGAHAVSRPRVAAHPL